MSNKRGGLSRESIYQLRSGIPHYQMTSDHLWTSRVWQTGQPAHSCVHLCAGQCGHLIIREIPTTTTTTTTIENIAWNTRISTVALQLWFLPDTCTLAPQAGHSHVNGWVCVFMWWWQILRSYNRQYLLFMWLLWSLTYPDLRIYSGYSRFIMTAPTKMTFLSYVIFVFYLVHRASCSKCTLFSQNNSPANWRHWFNVDLMLGQRRIRWPSLKPTLVQCILFAGKRIVTTLVQCCVNKFYFNRTMTQRCDSIFNLSGTLT